MNINWSYFISGAIISWSAAAFGVLSVYTIGCLIVLEKPTPTQFRISILCVWLCIMAVFWARYYLKKSLQK